MAVTQHTVVIAIVMSNCIDSGMWNPFRFAMKKPSATVKLENIATISLHALMRHQNQRSR